MDSERHNPSRISFDQRLHPLRCLRVDGIEQAGGFEEARRRLVRQAILQIAMVILIGLRMNDDRMIDTGLADKPDILFHRLPLRLIGRAVIRKPRRVIGEQVDMRFDQYSRRSHNPEISPERHHGQSLCSSSPCMSHCYCPH
jgi:hypothetical protein